MKNLLQLLALAALFSCASNEEKSSSNILENLSYSIDTLSVDSNGEVIDLGSGLRNFSLSSDRSSLFYFDHKRNILQEIDLQELKLINNFHFEREGPNSIGFNPPQFQSLANDQMLVSTYGFGVNIFGINGQKQKSLKFNFKEIEGLDYDEGGLITHKAIVSEDEKRLFALSMLDPSSPEIKLIIVDPEQKTGKTIPLPAMNQALESIIILRTPGSISRISGDIGIQPLKGKLYVTSSVTSDVYQYDYVRDSLVLIEFSHRLVPSKKTGEFKNLVSDEKEFYEEAGKLIYQISFEKLIWDEQRNLFFRFASKPIPDQEKKWYNEAEVFLFAYDHNLTLLGETHLPEINKVPDYPFFKDGKLWSCVNLDDELGFAVIDFKF